MEPNSPIKPNKIERLKTRLHPMDWDLSSVDWEHPDEESRFYLKNYGIYNIKLRPETWMLRFRCDGGEITAEALRLLAEIARRESLRLLLTARGQIELHDIPPHRVGALWRSLRERGISTLQTLTDNFRALLVDPLDDFAPDARINTRPLLHEIRRRFLGRRKWFGTLPRKFNTALIGRESPSFNPWGNDLLFALARQDKRWGFNLYLGGKNSETARSADIFCLPEEAADVFVAVGEAYRRHGLRGSRAKTRLFHWIEAEGIETIRHRIEESYGAPLRRAGELRMRASWHNRDDVLPIRRIGDLGEIDPDEALEAARLARDEGLTLRLTPHQELWLFDPEAIQNPTPSTLDTQRSRLHLPSAPKGSVTACAGSRYCPLALWEIKPDARHLPLGILTRRGIRVGFSGCLKGCGRHHHADIGLVGLRSNAFGPTERALRVFVGALEAPDPAPARMLFYAVPERSVARLFEVIAEDFEYSGYPRFEDFSRHVLGRYDDETLMLWYLLRQLDETTEVAEKLFFAGEEKTLRETLETLPVYPKEPLETPEVISALSHRLWDKTVRNEE